MEDGTGSCTGPGCQPDERISGAVAYVQVPALGATLGAGIGRLIPKGDWTPDVRPVAGSPGTFQVEWRVGVY